ncbi:TetR family transcriptional regulator C-terminal domain-containing protein [Streptomyces sp. NPDC056347]|uniref:TetR family transcriptional regulator C-terminal domain-containing protein n=1 Tax=Streptomyces sp. NPDC056347 TaxID=3345790 RepID=UPI0035D6B6DD
MARTVSNEPLRQARAETDRGRQEDLESLLAQGVRRGRFTAGLDTAARAGELLALLDGLSTRMVLGRRGSDPDSGSVHGTIGGRTAGRRGLMHLRFHAALPGIG